MGGSQRRHTWQDWLFVIAACLIMLLLTLVPFVLLIYLLKHTTSSTLKS
jgi:hypothetical protein